MSYFVISCQRKGFLFVFDKVIFSNLKKGVL